MPLRELSTLLSAGVPLTQALGALAAQAETADLRRVAPVAARTRGGGRFVQRGG